MIQNELDPLNLGKSDYPVWRRLTPVSISRNTAGKAADVLSGVKRETYTVEIGELGNGLEEIETTKKNGRETRVSKIYTVGADHEKLLRYSKTAVFDISAQRPICVEVKLEDGEGQPIKRVVVKGDPSQEANFYRAEHAFHHHDWAQPAVVEVYDVIESSGRTYPVSRTENITYTSPDNAGKQTPVEPENLKFVSFTRKRYSPEDGKITGVEILDTPNYVTGSMPVYQIEVHMGPDLEHDPRIWTYEDIYEYHPNGNLSRRHEKHFCWDKPTEEGNRQGKGSELMYTFDVNGKQTSRRNVEAKDTAGGEWDYLKPITRTDFPKAAKKILDSYLQTSKNTN